MTDTPPDVAREVARRYQQLSPTERLLIATAMFDSARALVASGLRGASPGMTEIELRVALFDRFYGRDVSPQDRRAIIERIHAGR
jgi:hypothetical protein